MLILRRFTRFVFKVDAEAISLAVNVVDIHRDNVTVMIREDAL